MQETLCWPICCSSMPERRAQNGMVCSSNLDEQGHRDIAKTALTAAPLSSFLQAAASFLLFALSSAATAGDSNCSLRAFQSDFSTLCASPLTYESEPSRDSSSRVICSSS